MGGSGIRSAVGVVVGLCSRWEAGNLLQRACGAIELGDCTVGTWGFVQTRYRRRLISISLQKTWGTGDLHCPMNKDARIHHWPYATMIRNHKARLTVIGGLVSLSPSVHTASAPSLILVAAVQSPLLPVAQCTVGGAPRLSALPTDHRCCPCCSFGRGRWARSG